MTGLQKINKLKGDLEQYIGILTKYNNDLESEGEDFSKLLQGFVQLEKQIEKIPKKLLGSKQNTIATTSASAVAVQGRGGPNKVSGAKKPTRGTKSKIPSTKEEFIELYKKQKISLPITIKGEHTFKDITIKVDLKPIFVIAPKFQVKGSIFGQIEGLEKVVGTDSKINSTFKHDFEKNSFTFDIKAALVNFKFVTNGDKTSISFDIDIMGLLTKLATTFVEEATKGVVSLTTKGLMGVTGVWDKNGFRLEKIASEIKLGIKLDPTKDEKVKKYFKGQDFKLEAETTFNVKTINDGENLTTTTAKGSASIKVKIGPFEMDLSVNDEGQAIATRKEREKLAELALIASLQDALYAASPSIKSFEEGRKIAIKANHTFAKAHAEYRAKAEKRLVPTNGMKATNTSLDAYQGINEIFDVGTRSIVMGEHSSMFWAFILKDPKLQKKVLVIRNSGGSELSTKRAKRSYDIICKNINGTFKSKMFEPIDTADLKTVKVNLVRIKQFKNQYPNDYMITGVKRTIDAIDKRFRKRLKELKAQ